MHALLTLEDPTVARLARTLAALRWTAVALGVVLLVIIALAVAIYRRNRRAALTRKDEGEL